MFISYEAMLNMNGGMKQREKCMKNWTIGIGNSEMDNIYYTGVVSLNRVLMVNRNQKYNKYN